MTDVTRALNAIGNGDPQAAAQLLPLVYAELRNPAPHMLVNKGQCQLLGVRRPRPIFHLQAHGEKLALLARPIFHFIALGNTRGN